MNKELENILRKGKIETAEELKLFRNNAVVVEFENGFGDIRINFENGSFAEIYYSDKNDGNSVQLYDGDNEIYASITQKIRFYDKNSEEVRNYEETYSKMNWWEWK